MGGLPRLPPLPSTSDRPIVLALPKGRVLDQAIDLFGRAGFRLSAVQEETRRLVHECGPFRVLVRSPSGPVRTQFPTHTGAVR